jgi:hypothetical protein
MKKNITQIITLALVAFTLHACGTKSKDATTNETAVETTKHEWVDLDLSGHTVKLPIIVKAPKGYQLDETSESQITINFDAENLNYRVFMVDPEFYEKGIEGYVNIEKVNVKTNVAYKFEKFIVETPESFIAKTSMGYISFRMIKVGDKNYACDQIPLYAIEKEEDAQELYKMMGMLKFKI